MPDDLQINVNVNAAGAQAGMDEASSAVTGGATEMATALATLDRGASGAERAIDRAAQSTRGLTRDTNNTEYALRYAAIRAEAYGGKLGGLGYVMARLGTASQGIFLGLAGALAAVVAVHLGEAFHSWYQDAIELKGALSALRTENERLAQSVLSAKRGYIEAEAHLAKLQGRTADYLRLERSALPLAPAAVVTPPKKSMEALGGLGLHIQKLFSELGEQKTIGGQRALASQIDAAIMRLRQFSAQASLKSVATQEMLGPAGVLMQAFGGSPATAANVAAQLAAAADALKALRQANTEIGYRWAADRLNLEALTYGATHGHAGAHGHPTLTLDELMRRSHAETVAGARKELDQMKAHERGMQEAAHHLAARLARIRGIPGVAPTGALPKSVLGTPPLFGEATSSAQIDQMNAALQKMYPTLVQDQKGVAALFQGMNEGIKESLKGVMMGTENMNMAWRRMLGNMALGTISHWAQILLTDAEGWATKLMLQTTAHATGAAIQRAADEQSILGHAKSSAVGAWADVMGMGIPPPLNFALAGAAAAAAFAGGMAVGAFAQGGIVPSTGPALLHQHEMVLPAHIAQHVMATAGGGGGAHGPVNISVSALDGADAHSVLTRNRDSVASSLQSALRSRNLIQ